MGPGGTLPEASLRNSGVIPSGLEMRIFEKVMVPSFGLFAFLGLPRLRLVLGFRRLRVIVGLRRVRVIVGFRRVRVIPGLRRVRVIPGLRRDPGITPPPQTSSCRPGSSCRRLRPRLGWVPEGLRSIPFRILYAMHWQCWCFAPGTMRSVLRALRSALNALLYALCAKKIPPLAERDCLDCCCWRLLVQRHLDRL